MEPLRWLVETVTALVAATPGWLEHNWTLFPLLIAGGIIWGYVNRPEF